MTIERALERSLADIDMEDVSSNTAAAMRIETFMLHPWRGVSEARSRLLPQPRCKVRNHRDRLVDLLGDHIQKNLLAVRRNVVDELLGCRSCSKGLGGAKLQSPVSFLHRHGRQYAADVVGIVKFLAIPAPLRSPTLARRYLPFALSAAEGYHKHFRSAGFGRCIGEP